MVLGSIIDHRKFLRRQRHLRPRGGMTSASRQGLLYLKMSSKHPWTNEREYLISCRSVRARIAGLTHKDAWALKTDFIADAFPSFLGPMAEALRTSRRYALGATRSIILIDIRALECDGCD